MSKKEEQQCVKNNKKTYFSRAYSPISRPIPDCLNPPKGACAFKWLIQLTLKGGNYNPVFAFAIDSRNKKLTHAVPA